MSLKIHTDFTSKNHTLHFESSGRKILLSEKESREFEKWLEDKKNERC